MKNNFKKIVAFLLAMAMCTPAFAAPRQSTEEDVRVVDDKVEETVPIKVAIDETNIICEANDDMLGIQYETSNSAFGLAPGDSNTELDPAFVELMESIYDIPLARHGGGSIEAMSLIRNVGAFRNRKPSVRNELSAINNGVEPGIKTSEPQRIGPVEWIKGVYASNPDASFIPCISMTCATPEENAQLAQFLLHKKDESSWGAMRASLGIEEPVNVFAFELGNEVDGGGGNGWATPQKDIDWYINIARQNVDAIKAVCPDAKFMLCGKTVPDREPGQWQQWTLQLCEEFKDDADYMSFHQYYGGYHMSYTRPYRDILWEDIKSICPDMKIVITEHAKWFAEEGSSDMVELTAVLNTGLFLARMYRRPEVVGATYHAWTGGGGWWSMFKNNDKGEYFPMGLCMMYDVYQKHVGDRVVWTELTSDTDSVYVNPTSSGERLNLVAMPKGKRELNLIFTNHTAHTEFPLEFTFKNNYTLEQSTIFTGNNMNARVLGPDTMDVFQTIVDDTKVKNFKSITMPPKSMLFLKLTSDKDLPQLGGAGAGEAGDEEVVYSGEKSFDDIEYSFAKNEILTLAENGIINGVTDTKFAPGATLTRAELAAILVRLIGKEEVAYNNLFTDVSANDWFAGSVATAYGEGLLNGVGGGKFNPSGTVTMEELITIVSRVYKTYTTVADNDMNIMGYLGSFKNKDDISPWAEEQIAFAVKNGLMKSMYENGNFAPKDYASREQTAAVMYKLYSKLQ